MKYPWLDGLRGLTALYVLLHHAAYEVPKPDLRWRVARLTYWLDFGHSAVAVFIVLSGYCLMLPVVRDPQGRLRGGALRYLARRARRILPAYYAAVALSIGLILLAAPLQMRGNPRWDLAVPRFWGSAVASHLLLVHNIRFDWAFLINPPLWTIATEWQIYLLFPLLLVVWRRRGVSAAIAAAFAASVLGLAAIGAAASPAMCPWYAALFAFGMAAACRGTAAHGPGRFATIVIAVGAPLVIGFSTVLSLSDVLVGASTAAFLAYCAGRDGESGPRPLVLRVLESPATVALGGFSYSLYLIHYPLLSLGSNVMIARGLSASTRFALMMLVMAPLVLLASFGFHLLFERPFLAGNPMRRPLDPRPTYRHGSHASPQATVLSATDKPARSRRGGQP